MSKIGALTNFDLLKTLNSWYQRIDVNDRKIFFIALIANFIVFHLFLSNFFYYNHTPRFPWIDPSDQIHAARWFTPVVIKFLYSANVPVLTPIFSMILNIISSLMLVKLWKKGVSFSTTLIITLFISLFPAMMTIFYYSWMGQQYAVAMFFIVLGLSIANSLSPLRVVLGSILIMFSMASYQACLGVSATVVLTFAITRFLEAVKTLETPVRAAIKDVLPKAISVVVGVLAYKVSINVFGLAKAKVTSTIQISELIERAFFTVKISFKHLSLTQPEFHSFVRNSLLLFVIAGTVFLIYKTLTNKKNEKSVFKIKNAAVMLTLIIMSVIFTKAMFFISTSEEFYTYRFNFALAFFYAFFIFVLLEICKVKIVNSVFFAIILLIILRFSQANLVRQGIITRGQQHDISLSSRILDRIENLDELDLSKKYILIKTGKYSQFRYKALKSMHHRFMKSGESHFNSDISDTWTPASIMIMLGSKVKWKYEGYTPNFNKHMQWARELVKTEGRKKWPHKSSVFIVDDKIIVNI